MLAVIYKVGCAEIDWKQLSDLYGEVGLVAGHGKSRNITLLQDVFTHSTKVVTAWSDGTLIGAARLLSDGVCYGMIFDVGVLPKFQKLGVGAGLMKEILEGNEHLFVHLTSTFGNEPFYSKLGFKRHKTAMAKYPRKSDYLIDEDNT
jgi:GNAT superfamily N-acetyltransferase